MARVDDLVDLAKQNVCSGVIEEPRFFFDSYDTTSGSPFTDGPNVVLGHQNVFRNGERFPIRLTHMTISSRNTDSSSASQDDENVDLLRVRMVFQDQYYMRREFFRALGWANQIVAAPDLNTRNTANWKFERPFVLSARDVLEVKVALEQAPIDPFASPPVATTRPVQVAFTGVGLQSKRPYFLEGSIDLSSTTTETMDTDSFRNDGAEPIVITDMNVRCLLQADSSIGDPGDVRQVRVNVRQRGNGTNQWWGVGPDDPSAGGLVLDTCPGALFGVSSGRALLHRFPGDGLIWEPGEGINIDVSRGADFVGDIDFCIGLFGYISVT